jgi:hypothetical protein
MKLREVAACVENEGFDYAFRHYSDFKEVKDVEFHILRQAYVKAAEALAEYLVLDE